MTKKINTRTSRRRHYAALAVAALLAMFPIVGTAPAEAKPSPAITCGSWSFNSSNLQLTGSADWSGIRSSAITSVGVQWYVDINNKSYVFWAPRSYNSWDNTWFGGRTNGKVILQDKPLEAGLGTVTSSSVVKALVGIHWGHSSYLEQSCDATVS